MKEKIKKVFKNRILIFILSGLVFGTIGVSAATYFKSIDVTYDNTESGLSANNVQSAIDELYTKIPDNTIVSDLKQNIVTSGDGLYEDEYEEGRYVYRGADPNNYLYFGGFGWRIISLEADGTIKIIQNSIINNSTWNSYHPNTKDNQWNSTVDLNIYLNSTYYNMFSSVNKNLIANHLWNTGGLPYGSKINLSNIVTAEKTSTYTGKIGLLSLSEYLRTNSNQTLCANNPGNTSCKSTNWIIANNSLMSYIWLITPVSDYMHDVNVIYTQGGYITSDHVSYYSLEDRIGVRPVVYLKSNLKLSGNGSQENPFIIIS